MSDWGTNLYRDFAGLDGPYVIMSRDEFDRALHALGPVAVARIAGCSRRAVYAYRDGRPIRPEVATRLRAARWERPTTAAIEHMVWTLGGAAATARALGVSHAAVYKWRKGSSQISREHAERLADLAAREGVASMTPDEFLARLTDLGVGLGTIAEKVGWSFRKFCRYVAGEIALPQRIVDAMNEMEIPDVH